MRGVLDGDFPGVSGYVFNFLIGLLVFEISVVKVLEMSVQTRGATRINVLRHVAYLPLRKVLNNNNLGTQK